MDAIYHRECGALEISDILLGIQLYFTDPSIVIRWVDANIVRNCRVKEHQVICNLPPYSDDHHG